MPFNKDFHTFPRDTLLAARLLWSRSAIRRAIGTPQQLAFVKSYGNTGDLLIEEGIRTLLSGYNVFEVTGRGLKLGDVSGEVAVIAGGGGWSQPYHEFMPKLLPEVERRFRRTIVLPSSFDVSVPAVSLALAKTKALIFAREPFSYSKIRNICAAQLAHDCAFYYDLRNFRQFGDGTLNAFRTDRESALLAAGVQLPPDNNDVSVTCPTLESWLETISKFRKVRTDRAHVMIAASLLGKNVAVTSGSYHKVPAIAAFSLKHFPIQHLNRKEI